MRDTANSALRQIIAARDDVNVISGLIGKQIAIEKTDELEALKKQAGEVKKGLDDLEKLYRTPEKTKGIVYSGDKVNSKLGTAAFYAGSGDGAPSPTSETYLEIAKKSLAAATEKVNAFMAEDVTELRKTINEAGITLLPVNKKL